MSHEVSKNITIEDIKNAKFETFNCQYLDDCDSAQEYLEEFFEDEDREQIGDVSSKLELAEKLLKFEPYTLDEAITRDGSAMKSVIVQLLEEGRDERAVAIVIAVYEEARTLYAIRNKDWSYTSLTQVLADYRKSKEISAT